MKLTVIAICIGLTSCKTTTPPATTIPKVSPPTSAIPTLVRRASMVTITPDKHYSILRHELGVLPSYRDALEFRVSGSINQQPLGNGNGAIQFTKHGSIDFLLVDAVYPFKIECFTDQEHMQIEFGSVGNPTIIGMKPDGGPNLYRNHTEICPGKLPPAIQTLHPDITRSFVLRPTPSTSMPLLDWTFYSCKIEEEELPPTCQNTPNPPNK